MEIVDLLKADDTETFRLGAIMAMDKGRTWCVENITLIEYSPRNLNYSRMLMYGIDCNVAKGKGIVLISKDGEVVMDYAYRWFPASDPAKLGYKSFIDLDIYDTEKDRDSQNI